MPITIVALEGDETGQELLEQSLRVLDGELLQVELEIERFDLSLENRRATDNAVVADAAKRMRETTRPEDPPRAAPPRGTHTRTTPRCCTARTIRTFRHLSN